MLKYRWTIKTSHESLYRESEISKIDEHLVNVLMKLVLRLNDATFRPFFSQLVELGYLSKDGEGLEKSILCATSLYSFLEALFEELKVKQKSSYKHKVLTFFSLMLLATLAISWSSLKKFSILVRILAR